MARFSTKSVVSAAIMLLCAGAFAGSGCASRGPDLAARMTTANAAYASVGYTPFGAPATGNVGDGKEARVPLALKKGCYQIVAFAGDGLKGVDVVLDDPAGKPVGTATKQEGQTSVKHCVPEAATYSLVVKSTGGAGSFLAQPYASATEEGASGNKTEGTDNPDQPCTGDDCPPDDGSYGGSDQCQNPPDLTVGASAKSTTKGKAYTVHASCAFGDAPSSVHRIHIEGRHKLVLDLSAKFDAVLALYRAAHDGYLCDSNFEVDCNDDSGGYQSKGHLEAIVGTGDYAVLVTGYDSVDSGEFELKSRLEDAPSLESVCAGAHAVTPGSKVTEPISTDGSNFEASCSSGAGSEALFKFDVKQRSRVRASMRASAGGESTLSIRSRCDDSSSEVACSKDWHFDGVSWTGILNAGAYTAITDTNDTSHSGTVDLNLETAPANGGGSTVDGETCKDAKSVTLGALFTVDTFHAKGDAKASCGAEAAADVVYKLDVKTKSRVWVATTEDDGHHVLALQKTCGETKGEAACEIASPSKPLEATVDPGTWYLVVKGKSVDDFGRAKLTVRAREIGSGTAACKAATKLVSGTPVNDTTIGAPDRFASEKCGGPIANQSSGDKVYQFTLKERSKVNLTLKTSSYSLIMSLRQDCSEPTKNELTCSSTYSKIIDRDLDPGTYYVVIDGYGVKAEGAYTLEMTAKSIK